MKSFLSITLGFCFFFTPMLHAGTLSIPSDFILQRPLNPALIVGVEQSGVAASSIIENDTSTTKRICEQGILKTCEETGSNGLLFSYWESYHVQLESVQQLNIEKGHSGDINIENRREQQHSMGWFATRFGSLAVGLMIQDNRLKFSNHYQYPGGSNQNGGTQEELSIHTGISWNLGDSWHLSFYRESIIKDEIQLVDQRRSHDFPSFGFQGYGIGVSGMSWGGWDTSWEVFQLLQNSLQQEFKLIGTDLQLSSGSWRLYAQAIVDLDLNYFEDSELRQNNFEVALGLGWNGENFLFNLGRDLRFFDGLDGGIKLSLGYQW